MIVVEPAIVAKAAQRYVGKRAVIAMADLPQFIPASIGEVAGWLGAMAPEAGPPFLRYWCIDMPGRMDVEVGIPVANAAEPRAGLTAGTLPAGRYGSLQYRDVAKGIEANAYLLDWMARQGHVADAKTTAEGDAFEARFEAFLSDPAVEPNPGMWVTEVAIRLKA